MAKYKVYFKASIKKDFSSIPKKDLNKILYRIALLSNEPEPWACEKLSGQERYRIRQGCYRIVYSIQDDALCVWSIGVKHRKNILRKEGII